MSNQNFHNDIDRQPESLGSQQLLKIIRDALGTIRFDAEKRNAAMKDLEREWQNRDPDDREREAEFRKNIRTASESNRRLTGEIEKLAPVMQFIGRLGDDLATITRIDRFSASFVDKYPSITSFVDKYPSIALQYYISKNGYYLIEIYNAFCKLDMTPPWWVIDEINNGFDRYLTKHFLDPKKLGKCFNLEGVASGAASPLDQFRNRAARGPAMWDMLKIIQEYGTTKTVAAKAVIDLYQFKKSVNTIKRWYSEYHGPMEAMLTRFNNSLNIGMSEYERTKFLQRFSPSVRRTLRN